MKKSLLTFVSLSCGLAASALTITVDDINYIVNEGTKTVYVDGFVSGVKVPEEVTVPATVSYEGEDYTVNALGIAAFYGRNFKKLTLPESITSLGEHSLEATGLRTFTFPSKVTELPLSAMANSRYLTSVTLPSGLTSIGAGAFADCEVLESIELPASVTYCGNAAFSNCPAMQFVNYLGTLITWFQIDFASESANPLYSAHVWKVKGQTPPAITAISASGIVKPYVFAGCTSIVSVEVNDNIESIGTGAFKGCSGLTNVTVPASLDYVGEWAFQNCPELSKVYVMSLPDFLQVNFDGWYSNPMSNGAELWVFNGKRFEKATTDLVVPEEITELLPFALNGCKSIETVTLHDGITSIGEAAFKGCVALKEISLPETTSTIGKEAFSGCEILEKVTMTDGVTAIGEQAFQDCKALTDLTLSEGLLEIPDYAFTGCLTLPSVNLPTSVRTIGMGAFLNCKALENVTFGEGIETIGQQAFASNALKSISISSPSLTSIDQMSFYDCMQLTDVTLGESLRNVGQQCFYRCMALKDVTCLGTEPAAATTDMCLGSTFQNATLHVPSSALESYSLATGWSRFGSIVALPAAGVDTPALADQESEADILYYRLDGTPVDGTPRSGIYIRVSSTGTSKVKF